MSEPKTNNVCEDQIYKGLFYTLSEKLRNFLVYKGSEVEQANDIVQNTFIKLWEHCSEVTPEKAKSYIYTLASNQFKNEIAHAQVKMKYAQSTDKASSISIETPEFKMEESEFKDRLNNAINSLPETQREVFLMNRIDKMKYSEIAETLGVSVKAIEKRMGKALKTLRAQIVELK